MPDSSPKIKCPTCRQVGAWFEQRWGPFCSERCKLIDLGKWMNQEQVISDPLKPEHFSDYEQLPPGDYLDKPDGPV